MLVRKNGSGWYPASQATSVTCRMLTNWKQILLANKLALRHAGGRFCMDSMLCGQQAGHLKVQMMPKAFQRQGHRGMFLANKATFTSCKRRARTARVTRQQGGHVSARSSMLWPNIQSETSGRTEDSAVTSGEAFALCECSKFVRETSDG